MKQMHRFLQLVTLLIVVLNFQSFGQNNQPNIVFILADDLGWADLPSYGNTFNEAPHLDKLAAAGMRFTNAYAACPVCSPTRASIQSGQYPARVGVIDFITGHWRPFEEVIVPKNKTQYLPGEIETLAETLKNVGYTTGYFGKWHLGWSVGTTPADQGYDVVHEYAGGGFYNSKFKPQPQKEYKGRLSEILTDMSIDFIEDNKNKPFLLFLAHYDVHVQLDADKDLIDKYLNKERKDEYPGNAVYAAMVEHVDNSVGRVVQKLTELGLEENTMVVFYSDNGGLIGRYDKIPLLAQNSLPVYQDSPLKYIASSNAPLRAEKGTVYEGGIREPLIVKWPAVVKPRQVCEAIVTSPDFYATFIEVAGANPPAQKLDGESLLPVLSNNRFDYERPVYWHYPVYHHDQPMGAIRKGDWKLVQNFVSGDFDLFNLRADISEGMDLSEVYPEKMNELKDLLETWQNDVNAEFPVPNPDFNVARRYEWGKHPDRK
jgi:uncharacterized sulfatase